MASLIEAMIDRACGFDSTAYEREQAAINGHDADDAWLLLHCETCNRLEAVEREPTDPAAATVLLCQCDRCNHGDFEQLFYFAVDGRELGPEDWPEACR